MKGICASFLSGKSWLDVVVLTFKPSIPEVEAKFEVSLFYVMSSRTARIIQ